jgi:hypothetical protein
VRRSLFSHVPVPAAVAVPIAASNFVAVLHQYGRSEEGAALGEQYEPQDHFNRRSDVRDRQVRPPRGRERVLLDCR